MQPKLVLAASVLAFPAVAPLDAAPLSIPSPLVERQSADQRPLNFRLVEGRVSDPSPIHQSGMIAHKSIGANTTLGIGLFKMAPKKLGSGEWRIDGKTPKSRRAAVSVIMRF